MVRNVWERRRAGGNGILAGARPLLLFRDDAVAGSASSESAAASEIVRAKVGLAERRWGWQNEDGVGRMKGENLQVCQLPSIVVETCKSLSDYVKNFL